MAEVKGVERRRLFTRHLAETMGVDKYHWRTRPEKECEDLAARVSVRSGLEAADQLAISGTFKDDKEDVDVISQVQEQSSRASSPPASAPSANDEIRDEEALLLPSRSRRLEARRHVSVESEERLSRWEARFSRTQARSRTSRPGLPEYGRSNAAPEESDTPSANPRDSLNSGRDEFENASQMHEQGPSSESQTHEQGPSSDLSLMINDELSFWPSTPGPSGASSSRLRASDGASASRVRGCRA